MEKIMFTTKLWIIYIVSAISCFLINYLMWILVGDTHMNILGLSIFIGLFVAIIPTFHIYFLRYAMTFGNLIKTIEESIHDAKTKTELEATFEQLKELAKTTSFRQQGYEIKRLKGLMDMKYNLL